MKKDLQAAVEILGGLLCLLAMLAIVWLAPTVACEQAAR